MKLFNWVHDKLNGRQSTISNTNNYASTKNQTQHVGGQKEEFSDWPQGFLSIGTLFMKASKEDIKDQNNNGSQNVILNNLTTEEVKELQKELRTLISSNDIDCISSLDDDKERNNNNVDHISFNKQGEEEEVSIDQNSTTIVTNNNIKDVYLDNNASKAVIGKKSLSFLLKKAFICGFSGSLAPTPSLRDPILSAAPKTKISKILRAMLRKKIYPQNSCSNNTSKKYIGMSGPIGSSKYDDEDGFDSGESSKWDKTDTEYIVLEI